MAVATVSLLAVRVEREAATEEAAQTHGRHQPCPLGTIEDRGRGQGDHPEGTKLEQGLQQESAEHHGADDGPKPTTGNDRRVGGPDLAAQGRCVVNAMEAGLGEPRQDADGHQGEGNREEICDARCAECGDHAPGEGARHQGAALEHTKAPQFPFEAFAAPGLFDQHVIDDGVGRPGLQGEIAPEQEGSHQVHRDVGTEPADKGARAESEVGDHQDATPAPAVGQDARRDLEEGHDHRVRRGEEADGGGGEPDVAQEQLLDRCPEADAEKEAGHKEWPEALSNSCRGITSWG